MFRFLPPVNLMFILCDLLQVAAIIILAEVIVSWAVAFGSLSPYKPWVRTLHRMTDPMLEPIRRVIPPSRTGGLDISPLIAVVAIQIVQGILFNLAVR